MTTPSTTPPIPIPRLGTLALAFVGDDGPTLAVGVAMVVVGFMGLAMALPAAATIRAIRIAKGGHDG
jgi:hypothetical protein